MARTHSGGGRRIPCPFVADGEMEDFPATIVEAEITRTSVNAHKPPGYYAMLDGMAIGNPMLVLTWELQTKEMRGMQESHGYRTKSRHGLNMQDAKPCGKCDQFWKADKKCPDCQIHFARFWLESTDKMLMEVFSITRERVLGNPPTDLIGGQGIVSCVSQLSAKGNKPFLMVEEVHPTTWRYEGSQETEPREPDASDGPPAENYPPPQTQDDDIPF